jgi:hypothetical protein
MDYLLEKSANYFDVKIKYRKKILEYGSVAQKQQYQHINSEYPIILDDSKRGSLTKIKDNFHGNAIVFVEKSPEKTEEFIKDFGNLFNDRASKLPAPVTVSKTVVRSKKKMYKIKREHVYYSTFDNCTEEFVGDFDKFDGYYAIIKSRSIEYNGHKISVSDIHGAYNLTDKDILIIDWEVKELPKLATPFLDYFIKNYYEEIENYYKDYGVKRVKNSTKFDFLYKHRKDFKEELDSVVKSKSNINIRNIVSLAQKLKLKLPENSEDKVGYENKLNKIIDINYPLMQVMDYRAYEGKASKHLKDYISSGDQEVFKNCLK